MASTRHVAAGQVDHHRRDVYTGHRAPRGCQPTGAGQSGPTSQRPTERRSVVGLVTGQPGGAEPPCAQMPRRSGNQCGRTDRLRLFGGIPSRLEPTRRKTESPTIVQNDPSRHCPTSRVPKIIGSLAGNATGTSACWNAKAREWNPLDRFAETRYAFFPARVKLGEPVGVGAGLDDVAAEGEPPGSYTPPGEASSSSLSRPRSPS